MLFYLTNSLITPDADPSFNAISRVINNLLVAYAEGSHLVMGDIEVLEWALIFYTDRHYLYGVLKHLINSYSMSTIPLELKEYVRIIRGERGRGMIEGKTVYEIPFEEFLTSDRVAPMRIIGEDENDSKFYGHICKWYVGMRNMSLSINYIPEPGGGKNTHRKVDGLHDRRVPHVCIVDTDQKYPGDVTGDTCRNCETRTYESPLESFYRIEAHEIENIIPKPITDELPCCNANMTVKNAYDSIWTHVKEHSDHGDTTKEKYWQYMDIKSGIVKKTTLGENPHWMNFTSALYEMNSHKNRDFQTKWESTENKAPVFLGLSTSILRESVSYFDNNGYDKVQNFLKFQEREWKNIGQLLVDKCVSSNSESMNY